MTYFVAWDLAVDPGSHHPGEIDAALEAAVDGAGGEKLASVSYGEYDAEPVSGHDPTEDLEGLSLRHRGKDSQATTDLVVELAGEAKVPRANLLTSPA